MFSSQPEFKKCLWQAELDPVEILAANSNKNRWSLHPGWKVAYFCLNLRMVSRILNCCQRFRKLMMPGAKSSWFPRWMKVRSCRMRPLQQQFVREDIESVWRTIINVAKIPDLKSDSRLKC